jgi:PAS domain S-box-containing protein
MGRSIRVLFIEDSEDDVWLLLDELRSSNYAPIYEHVYTPNALKEALAKEWDVIISDYKMPGFNAPLALKILKESDLDIPFIVVSGAILEETAVAIMRSGAHDYLMKDNLTRLVPVIEREMVEAANRRERRHAERRVLRLGQILDNSSNEIYVFGGESRQFIQVNRSACHNLGYSAEELEQFTLLDIQPELTEAHLDSLLNSLLSNERDEVMFETVHRRSDGTLYPVEVRLHLSRSENPPVFLSIVRDITERKRSEKELKIALDKITDLYTISRSVGSMRSIQDILVALLDSQYLNVSEALVLFFDSTWEEQQPPANCEIIAAVSKDPLTKQPIGTQVALESYPFVDLLSREKAVLIPDVERDTRLSSEARASLRRGNVQRAMLFPLENSTSWYGVLALYFKDGEAWSDDDIRHIQGLVDQVLIAIDNLTLLSWEAKARAQAEKANELKVQFLAMISHELRTPLTSIKGFSTTLLAEDATWPPESQREFLSIIDQESDKLTDLIEQLLDLSRLQAGTLSISPEPHPFNTVIDSSAVHLQMLTRDHDLRLDIEDNLPVLSLDIPRIAQVLENLVQNSVKYSEPNTRVTISARDCDGYVRVDVKDEGFGIPAEERKYIFEAFRQSERHKKTRGAGLGLAICKGLVEAHGGRIWIQDTNEQGTMISFSLPTIIDEQTVQD